MWFDTSMNSAYENGFKAAIKKSGYESCRIDRTIHNNKIDDEIISQIRRSKFLVADFTQGESGARGGVYYEAGFAQGLNIPVFFTCKKGHENNLHFDTRQFNHTIWENEADLLEQLSVKITAVLGDGPLIKK